MTVYCTVVPNRPSPYERKQIFSVLLEKLNLDPHQPIKKDGNGKPYLPLTPTAGISISHADHLTVYAASDTSIGVDIECPAAIRDPSGLCRRFFSDGEKQYVEQASDIALAVCEIWTKKEALAKHFGNGLSKNLHRDTTSEEYTGYFSTQFTTIDKKSYCITICSPTNAEIIFLNPEHFKF